MVEVRVLQSDEAGGRAAPGVKAAKISEFGEGRVVSTLD